MKRILTSLDDFLERLATFAYGPIDEGEERPGLCTKVGCVVMLGVLIAFGVLMNLVR